MNQNKKRKKSKPKMVQIGAFIGDADFQRKINQAIDFGEKGKNVKIKIQIPPSKARNIIPEELSAKVETALRPTTFLKLNTTTHKGFNIFMFYNSTVKNV